MGILLWQAMRYYSSYTTVLKKILSFKKFELIKNIAFYIITKFVIIIG